MNLANLVVQAYAMYAAFTSDTAWELTGDTILVRELWAKPEGLFSKLEPFGFIAQRGKTLFIVFRGTESIGDWLSDGDLNQVEHPLGKVHGGGWALYEQMTETIKTACAKNSGFELEITAHSLGCWLATFAAADLHQLKPTVMLYAAPRPGDIEFANNLNELVPDIKRPVNTEDIVPTQPPPVLGETIYCHVGIPIDFTRHTGSIAGNHSMALYEQEEITNTIPF